MVRHQYLRRSTTIAFRLLKHSELIGIDRRILMDPRFDVPPRKIASVGPRKSSRSEASHRGSLIEPIINVGGILADSGICQGKPDRSLPGGLRYFVSAPRRRPQEQHNKGYGKV